LRFASCFEGVKATSNLKFIAAAGSRGSKTSDPGERNFKLQLYKIYNDARQANYRKIGF